jgi:hypothetical protein
MKAEYLKDKTMRKKKRNLAFYKRSGEEWTCDEYTNIMRYVGEDDDVTHDQFKRYANGKTKRKYIFDDGENVLFMHYWRTQEEDTNFKNCKKLAYEDFFGDGK